MQELRGRPCRGVVAVTGNTAVARSLSAFFFVFCALVVFEGCQCRDPILAPQAADISFVPQRVVFSPAVVGFFDRANFEIHNRGRVSAPLRLSTTGPFSVSVAEITVKEAGKETLELTFSPAETGAVVGSLQVSFEEHTETIPLEGLGITPSMCVSPEPCKAASVQLETLICLISNQLDGTTCPHDDDICAVGGECIDGTCQGVARNCDDGDACTADSCDPQKGCVSFPATAQCGAPPNNCTVAVCDSKTGCGFVPVEDNTACGPSDCSTKQICLQGECKTITTTEGDQCGTASPCHPQGVCQNSICVRALPQPLIAEWTVWAGTNRKLIWDGIADKAGNLYWRETEISSFKQFLVSVSNDGSPRFAEPIEVEIAATNDMILVDQVVLVLGNIEIEGRSIETGKKLWKFDVDLQFPSEPVGSGKVRYASRGPLRSAYVGIEWPTGIAVALIDVANGNLLWTTRFSNATWTSTTLGLPTDESLPVDELGYLYGQYQIGTEAHYFSLSSSGAIRWDTVTTYAPPSSVFGGRVFHWDGWLSDTASGHWVNTTPPPPSVYSYPRLGLGAISAVATSYVDGLSCLFSQTESVKRLGLRRVDPQNSQLQWQREISGLEAGYDITNTILTKRGSVLFSQTEKRCGPIDFVLREISPQGKDEWLCKLPGEELYQGTGLLTRELWVSSVATIASPPKTGVRAFRMTGYSLPETGWPTVTGSNARDNHAQ